MKCFKILLTSIVPFLIALRLDSHPLRIAMLLAAVVLFLGGLLCALAELWCRIVQKPFAPGLALLWGGIALTIFSAVRPTPLGLYIGAACTLFGFAFWRGQRRRETSAWQAARQKQQEETMLYRHEQERLLTIDEVRLLDSYVRFKRGGVKQAGLGCLLAGPIGALLNGLIIPSRQVRIQRFQILYTSGRSGTEEHPVDSERYRELMQYVR